MVIFTIHSTESLQYLGVCNFPATYAILHELQESVCRILTFSKQDILYF
jgi:hypothetical protein